ncbi:MAG: transposase [Pirellulaceae bacterium]|nr:transposase [Pirellulaceae bacterium]
MAVAIHIHIDAAGQYASNLASFLRKLDLSLQISIGEPKRNKDYQKAFFAKRTSDDTESMAMARFGVVERPAPTEAIPTEFLVLREITSRLESQVRDTVRAKNRLHNLMSRVFPELDTLVVNLCSSFICALLKKYPTPEKLAKARLSLLKLIPYLKGNVAEKLHAAAKESVGSLKGDFAEKLVLHAVEQLETELKQQASLENLLAAAYDALPITSHSQIMTIPGIGKATAAVLVAKMISITRFRTPENLVGYFGIFPKEESSGVDKSGKPLPLGTQHMSHKGSDIVRKYLWNAAKSAIQHNPAVRALYARLRAKGVRGDVALGHCMRKLLHQVFGVWSSGQPYDETKSLGPNQAKVAAGRKPGNNPDQSAVTAANNTLASNGVSHQSDSTSSSGINSERSKKDPSVTPKDPSRESSRHDSAIPCRVARQQSSTPIRRAGSILLREPNKKQSESFCHAIPKKNATFQCRKC